ncbi:beta-ketoacyl-ACP synthase II [Candidatus Liberibacter asiaticus]|uniref:3-oxoacyl-[acyl-carrier-protein] synthase 2 n=2 Tax=Liberibacter asiaticus TaxID=34021 RepID=C6XF54_LIBAP|nr:beta-ketoacyl-ACP synthase II [Candidatus Liberibacter asiaticus]ACT57006.1 3-oxoacyl-(acyl carrier protein) synthase II [Candidatus Liberibacter asiaticus str. psy62]AGH17028.1 3-oxoacyl-(acyl carrier protein) synthase II [Candidatus Liberibacter asiaticus str. gxpsy]ALK07356.1 beta-ketoacyl-ACP synthase II [Candidatus Liberibacter asiaticus]ASK52848.1 beta-ketoacyl-[acyl-carrier-protein] synthase II [Candidatus Liberibacter asiaticus]AWL14165.1 beta-ketoacyl-[acyl-carrier-protein] synthas
MRRVVVTGLGMITPLGCGVDVSWSRLIAGEVGIRHLDQKFDLEGLSSKIAGLIPVGNGSDGTFNYEDWILSSDLRKIDQFILYGMVASDMALADSGWAPKTDKDRNSTGVVFGSGMGGLNRIVESSNVLRDGGPRKISPFTVPGSIISLLSGNISIRNQLRGPNHAVTTACSSGAHAIGDASRLIAFGDADVMVAGGAEAPICRLGVASFAACRALSTRFNDDPTRASRPFDQDRDGFVMGEGAGALVLEDLEHAKARGAKIYSEIIGYGLSGDAFHITMPPEDGNGAYRCMSSAIARAKLLPSDIDYINAHGTSTIADTIELGAVERLMGDSCYHVSMSSTKSAMGHLLGAAGAVEAAICNLAIRDGIVPATLNLDNPAKKTFIDLVPHRAIKKNVNVAMSNSFGFGGTNVSLVFRKFQDNI